MIKRIVYFTFLFISLTAICHARSKGFKIDAICIPDSIGSIEESYQGTSDQTIILIKDAHAFSEAQFNIAKIINLLSQDFDISTLGVEGASGELNVSEFRSVPFMEARNDVAGDYVKKGVFSGAEYAAISGEKSINIIGVEDKDLFLSNYKTFVNSIPQRDAIVSSVNEVKSLIAILKTKVFRSELKKFDQYINHYENGELDLTLFLTLLLRYADTYDSDLANYPNLLRTKNVFALGEEINFDRARLEQEQITKALTDTLDALPLDHSSKDEVSDIIARKRTELSESNFASFMLSFSEQMGVANISYDDLDKFVRYGEIFQDVDFTRLSVEIKDLAYNIYLKLSDNDEQRMLVTYDYYVGRLEHILSLEAVRSDAQWFIHEGKTKLTQLGNFLRQEAGRYNTPFPNSDFLTIEKSAQTAYTFYAEAVKRDMTFVDNLLASMNSGSCAILVAGGFHEDGILRILQERNISHIAINPYISSSKPDIAYLDKMRGNVLPTEPAATSNITVSLLYTELFSNYPKLLKLFTTQTVRLVIENILNGKTRLEHVVYHLYDSYELPLPSDTYAKEINARLVPVMEELKLIASESDTAFAEIAGEMETRIVASITEMRDQQQGKLLQPPHKELAVSIVVPVYNELKNGNIFEQISSFVQQEADPKTFELIFIVNNSLDDARNKTSEFEDNQRLLHLGAYLNAPLGTPQPAFFDDFTAEQRAIIEEAKQKGLAIHFIDRSTNGVPGIVEQHGIRIGTLRNIGIYAAIDRFDSLSRNGFIANLDADTTVPVDYVTRLISYSAQDNVDVIYTNLKYKFVGGNEFLFKTHFVQIAQLTTSRFPEYVVARAQQDIALVCIVARSDVFKQKGGFADLTTGEDIVFTRQMQRSSYGLLSTPYLTVSTQDRMRERGFDSDMRNRLGSSMTPDQFIMQHGMTQHTPIRLELLKRDLRNRSKEPIHPDELKALLELYGFDISPDNPAWKSFLDNGLPHQLTQALEQDMKFYLPNMDDNIVDFAETLLRNISEREYNLFRELLDREVAQENKDILQFQQELKQIYDAVWDHPDKATITAEQVAVIIRNNATHPILLILADENWFLEKIRLIGQEQYKESYYIKLLSQFRDWANPIDDTKRNVFRKGLVYLRVFNIFLQQSIHYPDSFPEFNAFLSSITGHDYPVIETDSLDDQRKPIPLNLTGSQALDSSL